MHPMNEQTNDDDGIDMNARHIHYRITYSLRYSNETIYNEKTHFILVSGFCMHNRVFVRVCDRCDNVTIKMKIY